MVMAHRPYVSAGLNLPKNADGKFGFVAKFLGQGIQR
jgi:hypothetical protein